MRYFARDLSDEPDAICVSWLAAPGTWYRPRPTEEYVLLWIIDGSATIECDGETLEILPGAVYCAAPWSEYLVHWDPRRTTHWGSLNFTPAEGLDLPTIRHAETDDFLVPLLTHMVALCADRPLGWQRWARVLSEYAAHILATGWASAGMVHDGRYSDLMVGAIAAIQRNWDDPSQAALTRTQLAADLGVTPRHLTRAFESEIGVGPATAMRMLRILRAARLLSHTKRSIREIADVVGFTNRYHFSEVFKSIIGVPPGEYRFAPPSHTSVPPRVERLFFYFRLY
jgi:AraC-like DNA-binding protein